MEDDKRTTESPQLSRRQLGLILLAGATIVLLVSLLAEPLGIGEGGGMGWRQYAGIVVGVLGVAAGLWVTFAAPGSARRGSTATGPKAPPRSEADPG